MNEIAIAIEAAHAAGAILRSGSREPHARDRGSREPHARDLHRHDPGRIVHKGAIDLVTEVDLACERAVLEVLGRHTPDIPVLAEEGGGAEHATTRWVVDPLDGTTNFVHGFPWYCVSVALEDAGRSVVGVIYDPVNDRTFAASAGGGATCDGQPIQVSGERELDRALVATGFGYDRRERPDYYLGPFRAVMMRVQGMRRAGSAALDLALAAEGRVDAYYELNLKRWDVAAGVLLVTEAGGRVSPVPGGAMVGNLGLDVVATNPWVHDALLAVLAEARGV